MLTREKISDIGNRIHQLGKEIQCAKSKGEDYVDLLIEKEIMEDDINYHWRVDEKEWLYALECQEFNVDGSLKYYD